MALTLRFETIEVSAPSYTIPSVTASRPQTTPLAPPLCHHHRALQSSGACSSGCTETVIDAGGQRLLWSG